MRKMIELEKTRAAPGKKLEVLEECFRENPKNPVAINFYAHAVLQNSKNPRLIDKCFYLLQSIEETCSDDLLTVYNLAIYSLTLGLVEEASKYFQQINALAPRNPHAQFAICCSLEKMNQVEFMQGYLETIRDFPNESDSYLRMSNHLVKVDAPQTALDLLEKYTTQGDRDYRVQNNLTILYEFMQDTEKYNEEKSTLLELYESDDMDDPSVQLNKAVLLFKEIYNLYCDEMNLSDVLEKISSLRTALEIPKQFVPKPVAYQENTEASEDVFYLKKAFEEKDAAGAADINMPSGAISQTGNRPGSEKSHSRSFSPRERSAAHSFEGNLIDKPLERIDEKDESSLIKLKGEGLDKLKSGSQTPKKESVVSAKELLSGKSLDSPKILNQLVPEYNATRTDPGKINADNISPSNGESKSALRSPSPERGGQAIPAVSPSPPKVFTPPPEPLVKDDIPPPATIVTKFLAREYQSILNQIEIEEEFEELDIDVNEEFECPSEDEYDEYEGRRGSQISVTSQDHILTDDQLEAALDQNPNNKLAHYRLGSNEIQNGNFNDNLKYHFAKLHKLDPLFQREIVEQTLGEVYFKEENYKNALYFYLHCLSIRGTEKFNTLVRIAQCYSKLNSLDNALRAYQEAMSRKDSHYLLYKQAKLYFKMGKESYDSAEGCIKACMDREPRYFKAQCLQGMIELEKEEINIKEAKSCFESVLKSENLTKNKEKKAYIGLARCKELEGNITEAMMNTRKALSINPYDNEVREKLALLYVKTRELRKAIHQYKLILRDEKYNPRIYLEIGTLFIFLNQNPNGQKYLEQALKIKPDYAIANLRLGKLLYKNQRKIQEALQKLDMVKNDPKIGYKAHFEIGCIKYDENIDQKEGIALIRMSIVLNPEYTTAWNKLGKIMDENENLDLSKRFFEKSLNISENFQGRIGLANYYFRLKEHKKCQEELLKIKNPQYANDVRCLKLKADNYFQMEMYTEALEMYKKCKNVESPFKDEVQIGIGNCYYKKDEYRNATTTFNVLETSNPKNIQIKINLAACYVMRNKLRDAIKVFENCRELDPTNWNILLYQAKVHMQLEEYPKAVDMVRMYIANKPEDYQGHVRLAELYEQLGAHQSAVEELEVGWFDKIALSLAPSDPATLEMYERVKKHVS